MKSSKFARIGTNGEEGPFLFIFHSRSLSAGKFSQRSGPRDARDVQEAAAFSTSQSLGCQGSLAARWVLSKLSSLERNGRLLQESSSEHGPHMLCLESGLEVPLKTANSLPSHSGVLHFRARSACFPSTGSVAHLEQIQKSVTLSSLKPYFPSVGSS